MSSGNFTAAASRKMEKIERNHPVTKLADELSTLAAELSEMEKLKQEFISNVSHEIQNPAHFIKGLRASSENRIYHMRSGGATTHHRNRNRTIIKNQ